jgi:hypothetical protein
MWSYPQFANKLSTDLSTKTGKLSTAKGMKSGSGISARRREAKTAPGTAARNPDTIGATQGQHGTAPARPPRTPGPAGEPPDRQSGKNGGARLSQKERAQGREALRPTRPNERTQPAGRGPARTPDRESAGPAKRTGKGSKNHPTPARERRTKQERRGTEEPGARLKGREARTEARPWERRAPGQTPGHTHKDRSSAFGARAASLRAMDSGCCAAERGPASTTPRNGSPGRAPRCRAAPDRSPSEPGGPATSEREAEGRRQGGKQEGGREGRPCDRCRHSA